MTKSSGNFFRAARLKLVVSICAEIGTGDSSPNIEAAKPAGVAATDTALTVREKADLEQCEQVLKRGLATFFEVGDALLTIRERRLYRSTHETFETYCHDRWNIGRSYAWRLIGAAERISLLPPGQNLPMPGNEFQVRPFLKLEPEAFPIAWEQAIKRAKDGKITPGLVRSVVAEFFSSTGEESKTTGRERPKSPSKATLGQVLTLLLEAKKRIEKGEWEEALAALDRIEWELFGSGSSRRRGSDLSDKV
jgi:hypothetical protein